MLEQFAVWLVNLIQQTGYFGILIAMFIESTFIPLPSELILIPAGYLWYVGELNPFLIILFSLIGGLFGSYFTYWLGEKLGRPFVEKHKRWFFLNEKRMIKIDAFFSKYGPASIFFARLILGIRHYISFPAGFAKMNKKKFLLYTAFGAGIWSIFLVCLGYFLGTQTQLIKQYITYFVIAIICIVILFIAIFIFRTYFQFDGLKIKRKSPKEIKK